MSSEERQVRVPVDGKPAANLEVELVADGIRYRDGVEPLKLKTDANGLLTVKLPRAGLYWLSTDATDKKTTVEKATQRRLGYVATLEVLP